MSHKFGLLAAAVLLLLIGIIISNPVATGQDSENLPDTGFDAPLKLSSSPIAAGGGYLLAANPESNSVTIVDLADYARAKEVSTGRDPRSVALWPTADLAFVANQGADSISVIDLDQGLEAAEIRVGDRPVSVVIDPDFSYLAAAEMGADAVRFLDLESLRTLSVRGVADRPYGLSFTPDGRYLLVSHLLSGSITVLPAMPYVSHMPMIAGGSGARTKGDGSSSAPPMMIETWPNVAPAPGVIVSPAGTRAYLPQTMANGLGLNTQFDTTVFPKVSVLNLETWQHETAEHISLPETDQPVGLPWAAALAKGGRELWVVNAASNDLSIVDISDPTRPKRRGHIVTGANPRGIALDEASSRAYVNNSLDGSVSVIDMESLTVMKTIAVTEIPLPPLLLQGKKLFHSSAQQELARASWISCNTCHIEGEHDGRTWQLLFAEQREADKQPSTGQQTIPRNTTSLLGMVETYPLRWSAEWDESADSEFSIRFEQFGDGLIDGEMHPTLGEPNQGRSYDLDALAAFIDSLPVPEREHELSAAEQRGKMIFESAESECLTCHPPPLYTDLQQHDVGTADAADEHLGPLIDTPTLRFLFDSSPYLHDGSAADLLELLTIKNEDDEHGTTSHLSEAALNDLVAYLLAVPHD